MLKRGANIQQTKYVRRVTSSSKKASEDMEEEQSELEI